MFSAFCAKGAIHSSILPGFQFRLCDLHRLPNLETLALDAVYQDYVLRHYQAAVARAEAEAAARRNAEEALALAKGLSSNKGNEPTPG